MLIAAGAGIGVDSGLPDFRGTSGFWKAYPALAAKQVDFHSIANPQSFRTNPALAWGFYGHRLNLYRSTTPHPGFATLLQWGQQKARGCAVFTSNVDGHFQKAGFAADAVYECHGSIHHLQCVNACTPAVWRADDFLPVVDEQACRLLNAAPTCPHCGGLARPNILMFDDYDWVNERSKAQSCRMDEWLAQAGKLVVLEIGAGASVPSVRAYGQYLRKHFCATLIRLNPDATSSDLYPADVLLPYGALEGINTLAQAMA
jgi:NAD-dependent SIR2 family protein deacetylase